MVEKDKYILVLGSKPESKLPDHDVQKIYTANGSAERADHFRKKYPNNVLTCITGAREYLRNEHVSKRINDANPENLIIRSGKIKLPQSLENKTKLMCLTNTVQWNFQAKFFKNKKISLFLGELQHQDNFFKKILHIAKALKYNSMQGVSTGFFCILTALEENPDTKIIISGIGMKGGKHFYKSERSNFFNYDSRAKVDRYMMRLIFHSYKENLFTTDLEMFETTGIKMWHGKLL